jgi:ankyrin repeat protein
MIVDRPCNPTDGSRNALHDAASNGHVEILLLLLESGARVNATNDCSTTALQKACTGGHIKVL